MDIIIENIKEKLNVKINNIGSFNDGTTNSLVFCINHKYLIKTIDKEELDNQIKFLEFYKDNKYFQDIIYVNKKLSFICFKYIKGLKIKDININPLIFIKKIYFITKSYKEIDSDFYGYLNYKSNTSYEFLISEIEYAKDKIPFIDDSKVYHALNNLNKYKVCKYLLHGDFGVHNFLIDKNIIKVIDPYPLVFDPLYDFYFACLSSSLLFINFDYLLKFYDRDINYKKNLLLIVFYIRMSRSYIYDKEHFNNYLDIYNNMENLYEL